MDDDARSAAGFTLVEVLLVAVAIAILLTASLPKFQHTAQRLRAECAAMELAQLARYAHARAVAQGVEVRLAWSAAERRAYLDTVASDGTATRLTESAARSGPLPAEASLRITGGDELAVCECARLFPDGTSDGATLALEWQRRLMQIAIDGTTSQVRVSSGLAPR